MTLNQPRRLRRIPLEQPVVVPGYEDLVPVRLGREPVQESSDLVPGAGAGGVARVHQRVPVGNVEALVAVGVGDEDQAHGGALGWKENHSMGAGPGALPETRPRGASGWYSGWPKSSADVPGQPGAGPGRQPIPDYKLINIDLSHTVCAGAYGHLGRPSQWLVRFFWAWRSWRQPKNYLYFLDPIPAWSRSEGRSPPRRLPHGFLVPPQPQVRHRDPPSGPDRGAGPHLGGHRSAQRGPGASHLDLARPCDGHLERRDHRQGHRTGPCGRQPRGRPAAAGARTAGPQAPHLPHRPSHRGRRPVPDRPASMERLRTVPGPERGEGQDHGIRRRGRARRGRPGEQGPGRDAGPDLRLPGLHTAQLDPGHGARARLGSGRPGRHPQRRRSLRRLEEQLEISFEKGTLSWSEPAD